MTFNEFLMLIGAVVLFFAAIAIMACALLGVKLDKSQDKDGPIFSMKIGKD